MKHLATMPVSRVGLSIGGVLTILGCVAVSAGWLDRANHYSLAWNFRHLGAIEADPRIVLIDIDDNALRALGSWPWPRRMHAHVVRTLHELGAASIVLDIVFSDASKPRIEHAGLGRHYDVDDELVTVGDASWDRTIFDDDELRDAMAAAGNVYLAMHSLLSGPGPDPTRLLERAADVLQRRPGAGKEAVLAELDSPFLRLPGDRDPDAWFTRASVMGLLNVDFQLDSAALVRELSARKGLDALTIERHVPMAKRLVARRRASQFLKEHPDANFATFLKVAFPKIGSDVLSRDRHDLVLGFRDADSLRALRAGSPAISDLLVGRVVHAYDPTLPLDKLAHAARGIGIVSFERERGGGVARAVPLVAETDAVLVFQLGLLVAMDALGIDPADVHLDSGWIVLGKGENARSVPLGADGLSFINWHAPTRPERWQDSFEHLPITRVAEIALNRAEIEQNQKRLRLATAALVERRHADTPAQYNRYAGLINQRIALEDRLGAMSEPHERAAVVESVKTIAAEIEGIDSEAVAWLQRAHALWKDEAPRDENEKRERDEIVSLYARLGDGQYARTLAEASAAIEARTARLMESLRPRIAGKLCLVGYTASGVADLVTSPVYSSMPGVMAHANVLNMVLQDRPAELAPRWLDALLMLVGGGIVTLLTCTRGPLASLLGLVVCAGAMVIGGGLAFRTATYQLAALPATIDMAVVWAAVTGFRQFVEERARRRFEQALSQYASPAVAARIARRVGPQEFSPQRATVTCFFSDLKGFTALSEQLGAERTRTVLNGYLERMSEVLVAHGALVNKFMGDGIFAFFNAPILPCGPHEESACACAAASVFALEELNRERGADDGARLVMRIGLTTGEAFVGDYGSRAKLDYTCIGDTVNLGSRIEQLGKVFGTSVLVDGPSRDGAGSRFAFRPLGRIRVSGKKIAVDVHELVGLAEDQDTESSEFIIAFEQVIRHYQACEWDLCLVALDTCRRLRPNDRATSHYCDAVHGHRAAEPSGEWTGVIDVPST